MALGEALEERVAATCSCSEEQAVFSGLAALGRSLLINGMGVKVAALMEIRSWGWCRYYRG